MEGRRTGEPFMFEEEVIMERLRMSDDQAFSCGESGESG